MIFSSQLGKLDGKTSEQAVKTIENHLRKIQEELEYRLGNLDSTNVTEIDTNETKLSGALVELISEHESGFARITLSLHEIQAEVADEINGLSSLVTQTAREIRSELSNEVDGLSSTISQTALAIRTELANEIIGVNSTIQQTASTIRAEVSSELESVTSSFQVSIGQIQSRVEDTENGLSTLTQTASSLSSRVENVEGNYSSLSQTVNGISSTVSNQGNSISSLQQASNSLSASVSSLQTGMSTALKLDSTGVYIVDQSGKQVTISGGQINAQGLVITSANLPADVAKKSDIPTSVSDLDNDSGFTSLSAVQSYISRQGYENATGIVEIIEGTVNADFINALGVSAKYMDGDIITVNYRNTAYAYMYAGKNTANTTAFEIFGINGLRLTGGGNIFLKAAGGQQLNLGADGLCQLSGGPLAIGEASYGDSLPSSGTWGQVFFLLE